MAPILCPPVEQLPDPTKEQLADPDFLLRRSKEIWDLWLSPDCGEWTFPKLCASLAPALRWILYSILFILVVLLVIYIYCTFIVFKVPCAPLSLVFRGGVIRIMDRSVVREILPVDGEPDWEHQREGILTPEEILYMAGARKEDFTRLKLSFTEEMVSSEEKEQAPNVLPS